MVLPGVYDFFNDKFFGQVDDVWIVSDPHFGDDEIKKAFPNRPSDDELVKLINQKAGRASCLICLGDVNDVSYVRKLRAKVKICLLGNHDKGAANYQRSVIEARYDMNEFPTIAKTIEQAKKDYPDYEIIDIEEVHQLHSPCSCWWIKMDNKMFDFIFQGPLMLGEKLILSHEPIPGNLTWACNLHGHTGHGGKTPISTDIYHYNVNMDLHNYQPVHLVSLLKKGLLSNISTLHRTTIDKATKRKLSRSKMV